MPIYEYRCAACRRKSSLFFRSLATVEDDPACPKCGERKLSRMMSRVWTHRSERSGDEIDAPSFDQDDVPFYGQPPDDVYGMDEYGGGWDDGGEEDVVAMARQAREMATMMGEPLDADFDQALQHIERGADPEDVLGELDEKSPPGSPDDD